MPCACLHLPQLSAGACVPHAHPASCFCYYSRLLPLFTSPSLSASPHFCSVFLGGYLRWKTLAPMAVVHPLNLHWMDPLTHEHAREPGRKHNVWRQVLLRDVKVRRRNLFFPLYLTQSATEQKCGEVGGGLEVGWIRRQHERRAC